MSSGLVWSNLVTYSLQIGLLVALASLVPALLRLRMPGAKLVYWHVLPAACLLLPLVRPWRQEVLSADTSVTTTVVAIGQNTAPAARSLPKTEIALGLLVLGMVIVGFVATQTMVIRPDPVDVVERDCALFYGPIGKDAEEHCRTIMLEQHLLPDRRAAAK